MLLQMLLDLEEAENRIRSAEELLETSTANLTKTLKRISYLEAKTDDLENVSI